MSSTRSLEMNEIHPREQSDEIGEENNQESPLSNENDGDVKNDNGIGRGHTFARLTVAKSLLRILEKPHITGNGAKIQI